MSNRVKFEARRLTIFNDLITVFLLWRIIIHQDHDRATPILSQVIGLDKKLEKCHCCNVCFPTEFQIFFAKFLDQGKKNTKKSVYIIVINSYLLSFSNPMMIYSVFKHYLK